MRSSVGVVSVPMRLGLMGLGLVGLVGCKPTVGLECDEDAARAPVYRVGDGQPAYPGQALLLDNCATCHSEGLERRLGAPFGLDFDARLVQASGADGVAQAQRLRRIQGTIHRHRDGIHEQVVSGAMPPRNFVPESSAYVDADGVELPALRTPEGQEMLRNWLACGSPVVERTEAIAMPCGANADCEVTNFCDTAEGQCVGVGDVVAPRGGALQARWSSIYPAIVMTSCAGAACHVGGSAGGLAMPDAATAYTNLVGAGPSASGACVGGSAYVVAGDPAGSLLMQKVDGVGAAGGPLCGTRMPIGPPLTTEQSDALRAWIMNGAMND